MENKKTVAIISENNLCCGCGVCKAVCPIEAIHYERQEGLYLPAIDSSKCVSCGKCLRCCPGKGFDYKEEYEYESREVPKDLYFGESIEEFNARTKNEKILSHATSGGIITSLVGELLDKKEYESAFLVDTYCHENQTKSVRISNSEELLKTVKSRYVPVSQETAVEYMKNHSKEKIILVGTSCQIQGIMNVIREFKLDRTNYLFVGLFCNNCFNYNIWNYFEKRFAKKKLKELFFRTKEHSGWPGNLKLVCADGEEIHMSRYKRMELTAYFQMERCLYCLDKLNQFADISVGDNYTKEFKSDNGSSSVIIRTDRGKRAWECCQSELESRETTLQSITASQNIDARRENAVYLSLKMKEVPFVIPPFEKITSDEEKRKEKKYKTLLKKQDIAKTGKLLSLKWSMLFDENVLRCRINRLAKAILYR